MTSLIKSGIYSVVGMDNEYWILLDYIKNINSKCNIECIFKFFKIKTKNTKQQEINHELYELLHYNYISDLSDNIVVKKYTSEETIPDVNGFLGCIDNKYFNRLYQIL